MIDGMMQETIGPEGFGLVMDVPVPVTAELDHRSLTFKELVNLDIDSLVPLSKPSGENIDVYVGDVLLASGEILVVGAKLAVRVAELRDKLASNPGNPSGGPQMIDRYSPGRASTRNEAND